jgi:hypothetical protein
MSHYVIKSEGPCAVNGLAPHELAVGEMYSTTFDGAPGRTVFAIAPHAELVELQRVIGNDEEIAEDKDIGEDEAAEMARWVFRRIGAEEVELRVQQGELSDAHDEAGLDVEVHLGGPALAMARSGLGRHDPGEVVAEGDI